VGWREYHIAGDNKGLQACDILDPYYSKTFMAWIIIFNCKWVIKANLHNLIMNDPVDPKYRTMI